MEQHQKDILTLLPGKHTRESLKNEMLRVDHAGEYGAVHIYRGQRAPFLHSNQHYDFVRQINHMAEQEYVHLNYFDTILPERRIRPSMLSPLWKRGGFVMGALTALVTKESAMACTEAVETVIDVHYAQQIDYFECDEDSDLPQLKQFQQDELAHKQEAIHGDAHNAPLYSITTTIIQNICHCVIKLAHKL